jgi:RNA 2',3'-cyclic 3'-phosphodiesterase
MNAEESPNEKPKKIRAFIALKTPAEWDEKSGELQNKLKASLRSTAIRWVKPEQIHITLRFLGYILPEEADRISAMLPGICDAHREFRLRCEGLGCFPNAKRARVLWAGLSGDLLEVQKLQESVVVRTREIGEAPENRPFKPHLTLARIQNLERSAVDSLEQAIARGFVIESDWNVNELILMRSHLSPQEARYEVVTSCGLKPQSMRNVS